MATCPKCGRSTAEGAFCERCGAELPAPERRSVPAPCAPSGGGTQRSSDRFAAASPVHNQPHNEVFPRGGAVSAPQFRATERAFASIDERLREVDERIEHETSDEALLRKQRGEPALERDDLCTLFENMNGILRFRLDPTGGGERVENVTLTFSNCDCQKTPVQRIRHADRPQEFPVQFPPQAAGLQSWEVRLEYFSSSRKHELVGQFQVFVRPVGCKRDISIRLGDVHLGDVSGAGDVRINQGGVEGLADLIEESDPFRKMELIAMSRDRKWVSVPLSDDSAVVSLPPMPAGARTERVVLDFGNGRRMHLFAGRTVQFGKTRELNDFVLRPARPVRDCSEAELVPYKMVSHCHCFFEHSGERMTITDGWREANGVVSSSTNGTFWNDEEIRGSLELPVGTTGIVSFARPACAGGLSMDLRVCGASKACATCPHSNIHWCGEGKRPSMMLTRRDGLPEKYIAVWSCFWLGEADPSLEGVVIFRKDGAFAFRDTYRSGWIVPGTDIQTDYGPVRVLNSQLTTLNS